MTEAAALNRPRNLAALASDPNPDVLILGGGVNGAGIFRELSLQNLRCVLVEQNDFAAGASGASTRVANGGLRYLEQGRLKLVRESSVERNRLVVNAPHLVRPLQVAIPVESYWGGIAARLRRSLGAKPKGTPGLPGLALLRVALAFYDLLGRRERSLPLRGHLRGEALRRAFPGLSTRLTGIGWSWEGRIGHPERIVVELIEDALAAHPAGIALNHCALEGAEGGRILLRDRLHGTRIAVKPRLLVNATGAWVDRTNTALGIDQALVRGSKGSHLLLDNPALHKALDHRLVFFGDGNARLCMAYPLGEHVLVGATDIPVETPDDPVTGEEEIAYLLDAVARLYPGIPVTREQIRHRWCGVRPLPRGDAAAIGEVSRDHHVAALEAPHLPFPVLALVGGKWTSFRAAAEQLADRALPLLGRSRRVETAHLAIGGAQGLPRSDKQRRQWLDNLSARTGLPPARLELLLDRYGARAARFADHIAAGPDAPLPDAEAYSEREVRFLIQQEMAQTLEDILARRTTLALQGSLSRRLLSRLQEILTSEGGAPESDGLEGYLQRHGIALV